MEAQGGQKSPLPICLPWMGMLLSAFFLDANTGWVITPDPQYSRQGQTVPHPGWRELTGNPLDPVWRRQPNSWTRKSGWALYVAGVVAAGSAPADIYHTQDGGQSWTKVYGIDPLKKTRTVCRSAG
jgi:hypothetical protein